MIAIGIDIGGTSIKGAAIDSTGKVYDVFSMPVIKGEKGEETIGKLSALVNEYIASHHFDEKIEGIGLGVPGIIDSVNGVVSFSSNLKWENLPIRQLMEDATGLKVKITNDANAAALGEARFGAGKNYSSSIMITLGTGVGGGVVIGNKLVEGNQGKGAELGHMVIVLDGRECGCGRKGCLEAYASATGLIVDTKIAMEKHPESLMHKIAQELGKVDARVAFNAEKQGDKAAKEVIDQYIMYLSEGLMNYCNIFRPEVFILSGGIANEGKNLTDRVEKYLKEHDYGYKNSPSVDVVIASLGYDSGKIGAACLIL